MAAHKIALNLLQLYRRILEFLFVRYMYVMCAVFEKERERERPIFQFIDGIIIKCKNLYI